LHLSGYFIKCNNCGLYGEKNKSAAASHYSVIRCVNERGEDRDKRERKRN
jgi:hypothetical protein